MITISPLKTHSCSLRLTSSSTSSPLFHLFKKRTEQASMAGSGRHPRLRNETQTENRAERDQREETQTPQGRLCDFCGESKALLYCRADSAKLCFGCDREVHSTNLLFTKHTRNQLCDGCDSKPASIHCSTENTVLCQNCDWDSHGGNSAHDRRPLEGFTGCPSACELCSILGFKDLGDKSLLSCGGGCDDDYLMGSDLDVDWISDLLVWETPSINSFDDLILSTESTQNFQALDVPSLPKNRDTVCGKYKEAIVCQLRDMLKLETSPYKEDVESLLGFQPLVLEPNLQPGLANTGFEDDSKPIGFPIPENNGITWKGNPSETSVLIPVPSPFSRTFAEESSLVNDKANDCSGNGDASDGHGMQSQHSIIREPVPFLSKFAPSELTSHNRDSSLSRYKEKKKTRRYDKHIRYETRKARAESRTRIKGRFAKVVNK